MRMGLILAVSGLMVVGSLAAFGQGDASGRAASPTGTNMGILQPAIMTLQQAMDSLRVDKWKAPKDMKAETIDNIASIRRDVEGTLPGLVTAADAAPDSLTAMLSLSRNVGALYDVVLRVTVIAESAAPADQNDVLEKSLSGLENVRRTLADRQQQMAASEEARIGDLQKQLNARPALAAVCPPVVTPAPAKTASATTARRKKRVVKPAAKAPAPSAKPAGAGVS